MREAINLAGFARFAIGASAMCAVIGICMPALAQFDGTGNSPAVEKAWRLDSPAQRASSSRIDGGSVMPGGAGNVITFTNGIVSSNSENRFGFYWETRVDPPTPKLGEGFGTRTVDAAGGLVRRVLFDRTGRTYFGYEAKVEALREANSYRITFKPLVITPELAQRLLPDASSSWTALPAPRFAGPQTIHAGDILALNLLTNSATGQRIVDYVTIQEPARRFSGFDIIPEREFAFATGTPRDLKANDVELRLQSPRLIINGKILQESTGGPSSDVAGIVVWFYVPNQGRFSLSLLPHPELGFIKAGQIRGTSLSFTSGADTFALSSGARIAPGQAVFNLYVLREPAWKPTYPFADLSAFIIGSADSAEALAVK